VKIEFRQATNQDIERCIEVRGLTSDNQFTKSDLAAMGVTAFSWSLLIENSEIIGAVALEKNIIVGFCFGGSATGEILVLAVLSGYESLASEKNFYPARAINYLLRGMKNCT
jgi:hypothetical protein